MAVAISEESLVALSNLQPLWHEKAPRSLIEKHTGTDPFAGWKTWQKHLRTRKEPSPPRFIQKKGSPLLWSWPRAWGIDELNAALASPTTFAEVVIGEDARSAPDLSLSLQLVALAYALPKLAAELPADTWWFLVERLHATATQAMVERIDLTDAPQNILRNQLLAGELPLALGLLFPEVRALRALRTGARAALTEALVELTDGQGLPHGRLLPVVGPLFACWTRARLFAESIGGRAWARAAELQYEWLVRHAIRLADNDGSFLLSPATGAPTDKSVAEGSMWTKALFATAIKLAGDRSDGAAAKAALPAGIVAKKHLRICKKTPAPSLNSDWAGVTIMSDGWAQSDARLAISYVSDPPTLDLSVDGEKVFLGEWQFTTTCDGKPVEAAGEWEQLCWESGKEYDFLELGLTLTSGLHLERQILFGREDRVLYLADIVLSDNGTKRRIEHSSSLPLAIGSHWTPENETRDGTLSGDKFHAAVLPLALHEWRADPRSGSLVEQSGKLTLAQSATGSALCCPLFIDLDRKRSTRERTWRQLSIAEWMELLPPDVAVGYRAQSGDDQWLIYRSLGAPGNRSLLSHNIAGEFCAGRFVDGKFKEWIEIEAV